MGASDFPSPGALRPSALLVYEAGRWSSRTRVAPAQFDARPPLNLTKFQAMSLAAHSATPSTGMLAGSQTLKEERQETGFALLPQARSPRSRKQSPAANANDSHRALPKTRRIRHAPRSERATGQHRHLASRLLAATGGRAGSRRPRSTSAWRSSTSTARPAHRPQSRAEQECHPVPPSMVWGPDGVMRISPASRYAPGYAPHAHSGHPCHK
jgi:hypothetical protein